MVLAMFNIQWCYEIRCVDHIHITNRTHPSMDIKYPRWYASRPTFVLALSTFYFNAVSLLVIVAFTVFPYWLTYRFDRIASSPDLAFTESPCWLTSLSSYYFIGWHRFHLIALLADIDFTVSPYRLTLLSAYRPISWHRFSPLHFIGWHRFHSLTLSAHIAFTVEWHRFHSITQYWPTSDSPCRLSGMYYFHLINSASADRPPEWNQWPGFCFSLCVPASACMPDERLLCPLEHQP